MTSPPNQRTSLCARCVRLALWAALTVTAACSHAASCPSGSARWQRSELFMGQLRSDGGQVDERAFARFVEQVISPALPRGFTLLATEGQYRDPAGTLIREPGKLLIVLHQGGPSAQHALERVRTSYRESFDQQSVLRTDSTTCASF